MLLARRQETLRMIQEGLSVAGAINADPGQIVGLYLLASKCLYGFGQVRGRPGLPEGGF